MVEVGGKRMEGGGWRVEDGGWRVEGHVGRGAGRGHGDVFLGARQGAPCSWRRRGRCQQRLPRLPARFCCLSEPRPRARAPPPPAVALQASGIGVQGASFMA